MDKPKVSIIVPVYNVEQYLDNCIKSLLNQSLKDIEVILVDDESPDNCPQMCDEYAEKDSRIKVIHKKNGGLGLARNSGLTVATGEYVAFVDSDDYVELDAYKNLYEIAHKNKLEILRFGLDRFKHEGEFIQENKDTSLQILDDPNSLWQLPLCIFSDPLYDEQKHLFSGGSVCVALFKLDFLQVNGLLFTSEKKLLSEDFVFTHECYKKVKRIGNIPYTYYHYRLNPCSITTSIDIAKINKVFEFCKYYTNLYRKDGFSEKLSVVYPMGYYLSAMRSQSKLILLSNMHESEKKKWFDYVANHSYTKMISKTYPLKKLTKKQQLHFYMFKWHCYYLLKFMVMLFDKMKS